MSNRFQKTALSLTALAALALAVGAGAGTDRGPTLSLRWQSPTPRDGAAFAVEVGQPFTLELAAASSQAQVVRIGRRPLPYGVAFRSDHGRPSRATVTWTPRANQVGEHVLTFTAGTNGLPQAYARPRSFLVYVKPATPNGSNEPFALNGPRGMSRWAHVLTKIPARTRPSASARILTRLEPLTPELTQNLVQTLEGQINEKGEYWVRVRLPILPNSSTGWIPRGALAPYNKIWTHLVIDRRLFTATLYRRGVAVFRTRIGVGKAYWPTPAGKFYVRERITGFSDLIYGPLAFGTNARSAVLTDWPGGGFIGIHGTSQPEILPGRVSHGCVRMPNPAVLRLARLMPLGTPVTIH
jgi:L,D-transpeptidase catalytic domain